MKNVQIPYDLFVALVEYHLGYDDDYEDEIRQGLEQKLDALVRHELYAKYKTAPSAEEREQARQAVPGPARRIPRFSLVTGIYFHTNLADEISTKVNFLPVGIYRSVTRSCGWRTRQIGWQCTLSVSPSPIGKSADLAMAKAGRIRWIFPACGRRNWSKRGCEKNAGHTAF